MQQTNTNIDTLSALRIGLHHATRAADLARALKTIAHCEGMHGTAAMHEASAVESEQAAEAIRAAIAQAGAPDLLVALVALADAVESYVPLADEWPELSSARAAIARAR